MRRQVLTMESLEKRRLLAAGSFLPAKTIAEVKGEIRFSTGDIDGDHDIDVVIRNRWLKNQGQFETFVVSDTVDFDLSSRTSTAVGDFDGDGHNDIVAVDSSSRRGPLLFLPNLDGTASFEEKREFFDKEWNGHEIAAGDLDGDGDLDIVTVLFYSVETNQMMFWFENTDGMGTFARKHEISNNAAHIGRNQLADIDGDSDIDIVTSQGTWFENTNGSGDFQIHSFQDRPRYSNVATADIDGDGDLDVAGASYSDDIVFWHENIDGQGQYSEQKIVDATFENPSFVALADLDLDGHVDLLMAEYRSLQLLWYPGSGGNFQSAIEIDDDFSINDMMKVEDLDHDGDLDIIAIVGDRRKNNSLVWYENQTIGPPWDVNGDGIFDSSDLVVIFQAGEYEDEIAGNSTFEEGDFDGDGDFTTTDLVFAFTRGRFVAEAIRKDTGINQSPFWLKWNYRAINAVIEDGGLMDSLALTTNYWK